MLLVFLFFFFSLSGRSKSNALDEERNTLLRTVGNVVHDSVPVSDNEDNNAIVRTIGDAAVNKTKKRYSHIDLIAMIDGVDTVRGSVVAGARVGPCPAQAKAKTGCQKLAWVFLLTPPPCFLGYSATSSKVRPCV